MNTTVRTITLNQPEFKIAIGNNTTSGVKTTKFGGAIKVNSKLIYITRVLYNDPATVVFWSDGTKTITKCSANDTYNPETGLAIAVLKKSLGATEVHKLFEDWLVEDTCVNATHCTIELKDVRKKHTKD